MATGKGKRSGGHAIRRARGKGGSAFGASRKRRFPRNRRGRDIHDVGEDVARLARMLDALAGEAMTVEAVDGYLTALALFREKVSVSEWMAPVYTDEARFDSVVEADLRAALVRRRNAIARTLATETGKYGPVLVQHRATGQVVWADWILGFEYAARLCRAGWARIEASRNPDVVEAVRMLETLYTVAKGDCELPRAQSEKVALAAPALICGIVWALHGRERSGDTGKAEQAGADTPAETVDMDLSIAS